MLFPMQFVAVAVFTLLPLAQSDCDDGSWSLWGEWSVATSWSDCPWLCGGGGNQTRSRTCSDPTPTDEGTDCTGSDVDVRACPVWPCQDCWQVGPTPGGFCDPPQCPGEVFTHRVQTGTRLYYPLEYLGGVEVYLVGHEWEPYALTDCHGYFTILNVCRQNLQLFFRKDGFLSQDESYDVSGETRFMRVVMNRIERPFFREHAPNKLIEVGESASFVYEALGNPLPHTYEWYKDGVFQSQKQPTPGDEAIFVIDPVSLSDTGTYTCVAVSTEGYATSKPAHLQVQDTLPGPTGNFECEPSDYAAGSETVDLHPNCVTMVESRETLTLTFGTCDTHGAVPRHTIGCCQMDDMEPVTVMCPSFTYQTYIPTGCVTYPCESAGVITIEGFVRVARRQGASISYYTHTTTMNIEIQSGEFPKTVYTTQGRFFVEILPFTQRAVLSVTSRFHIDQYFPHTETIHLQEGVWHYTVLMTLMERPSAIFVPGDTGGQFSIPGTAGLPSDGHVTIPRSALTDSTSGDPITGDAQLYVYVHDVRLRDGMVGVPGDMTHESTDGEIRYMMSHGVFWFHFLSDNSGPASLNCPVDLDLSASALVLDKSVNDDSKLWLLQRQSATWTPVGDLEVSGSGSSYKAEGSSLVPHPLPAIHAASIIPREDMCEVAVYVHRATGSQQPMPGVKVTVTSKNRRQVLSQLSRYTDRHGKACLPIPCGFKHEVYVDSVYASEPSCDHHLPKYTWFRRTGGSRKLTFRSKPARRIRNEKGPVHRLVCGSCSGSGTDDYYFKFLVLDAPMEDHLGVLQPLPANLHSWYKYQGDRYEREHCMVRVAVQTLDRARTQVIAVSMSEDKAVTFGTATTGVQPIMDPSSASPVAGQNFACLEVKCSHTDVVKVDLVAIDPRGQACPVVWQSPYLAAPGPEEPTPDGPELPIYLHPSVGSNKLDATLTPTRYSDNYDIDFYMPGFHRLMKSFEQAKHEIYSNCLLEGNAMIARFDCSNGAASSGYWDDPPIPNEHWELGTLEDQGGTTVEDPEGVLDNVDCSCEGCCEDRSKEDSRDGTENPSREKSTESTVAGSIETDTVNRS